MLRTKLFIGIIFLLSLSIYGQFPGSPGQQNSIKEILPIPKGMTFNEFLKIQREVDWKKVAVASILPGYIHFYAEKPELGWTIFGVRLAGFSMMTYAMYDQYKITNALDFAVDINTEDGRRTKSNAILFSAGFLMNMFAYAFDWAHGEWVVETERNEVYFKYGLDEERRKELGLTYNSSSNFMGVSVSLKLF